MDDYPLLNIFFTMLWFFLFVGWIYLLVMLVTDVFRSHDLNGWAKALWTLFILILPVLGAIIYLIARGEGMTQRQLAQRDREQEVFRSYVQENAGPTVSVADELNKLAELRTMGTISTAEFEAQKTKLLAS